MKNSNLLSRILFGFALLLGSLTQAWSTDNVIYYHNDALGSPVAISDNTGQVLWKEAYEPYGKRILNAGGHNTLWYTGKPEDTDLGLNYFGARWYDPKTGRFTGIDPIDFRSTNPQSFNRYAYAINNPYRYVDPDGRVEVEPNEPYGGIRGGGGGNPVGDTLGGIPIGNLARGGAATRSGESAVARGAKDSATTFTNEGEVFVRVGANPRNLKMTVDGKTGTLPGTYAFPKSTFDKIGNDPGKLKDLGDLPKDLGDLPGPVPGF